MVFNICWNEMEINVVWKSWIMLDIGVFFLQKILNNNYQMFQASQDETTKDNIDPSSLKL